MIGFTPLRGVRVQDKTNLVRIVVNLIFSVFLHQMNAGTAVYQNVVSSCLKGTGSHYYGYSIEI